MTDFTELHGIREQLNKMIKDGDQYISKIAKEDEKSEHQQHQLYTSYNNCPPTTMFCPSYFCRDRTDDNNLTLGEDHVAKI